MACNCQPCTLDPDALTAKVIELLKARIAAAFHNRTLPCQATTSSHWWTGTWNPVAASWSGRNKKLHGLYTLISVQDLTITLTFHFFIEDLGTWADQHPST